MHMIYIYYYNYMYPFLRSKAFIKKSPTVQITFIFIDFRVCDLRLRLKRKTHPAFRVLNAFYFHTYFNLRFKRKRDVRLTCKRV